MKKYNFKYMNFAIEDKNKMVFTWLAKTENMTDEEFMDETRESVHLLNDTSPDSVFLDCRELMFVITPGLQDWMNNLLVPVYIKNGIEKIAVIVSNDLFTKISVEQTLEENKDLPSVVKYFDNEDEANSWLKKD